MARTGVLLIGLTLLGASVGAGAVTQISTDAGHALDTLPIGSIADLLPGL